MILGVKIYGKNYYYSLIISKYTKNLKNNKNQQFFLKLIEISCCAKLNLSRERMVKIPLKA